jgi:putative peptide zinc metalloprotease protein
MTPQQTADDPEPQRSEEQSRPPEAPAAFRREGTIRPVGSSPAGERPPTQAASGPPAQKEPATGARPLQPPPGHEPPLGEGAGMTRSDVYTRPMAGGRATDGPMGRLATWMREHLSTADQRKERTLDDALKARVTITRPNTIAVLSPKGGVGKTTTTFLLGNLLAGHLNLRAVAIDANPDFGTLAALAPDELRSERSLADVIGAHKRLDTIADLSPYVSRLPTGLHILGAPARAEVMAEMTPNLYGQLITLLSRYYEVILLDLGTGITDQIATFAIEQADQMMVITTPEWVTAANVLGALRYLSNENATLVLNQADPRNQGKREVIEANFRRQSLSSRVTIPYDERLRTMLDSGSYDLDRLSRATRLPIKELGVSVSANLV